ncbi:helix-turn-helix domain-containing protein [Mucilaginibacter sp. AW1-3]
MWNQDKLQEYIDNQIEENINLDYKASGSLQNTDSKKTEISKDVSAFANSNGGLIIYGMTEKQVGAQYLPDCIDPIDRTLFSKETLEQIINSRINPTIHGILIHPITIGSAANNQVVYVVEIPPSNTAHQAYDKKYYRRYNFQSVPMDDWEIKDIINRQTRTQAEINFRPCFSKVIESVWLSSDKSVPMEYEVLATNVGQLVIHHVDFIIAGSKNAVDYVYNSTVNGNKVEHYFTNEVHHKLNLEGNESTINIQRMPILSQTWKVIGKIKFSSEFLKSDNKLRLTIITDDNRTSRTLTGKEILKELME